MAHFHNVRKKLVKRDSLWAWAICLCALINNAVVHGIDGSFGEIIGSIIVDSGNNAGTVAWIGSVHSSCLWLFASVSTILIQKYGFLSIMIGGVIISCIAYICASFTENIILLILTHGVLGGVGSGLLCSPGQIICTYYFEKHRAIATGLAMSGGGVGIASVSLLANYLDMRYGARYVFFAFCLLSPLSLLLGAMAIPLENEAKNDEKESHNSNKESIEGKSRFLCFVGLVDKFKLLRDSRLALYCLVHIMFELAYYIPITFLPEMMHVDHGLPKSVEGIIMVIFGISNIFGKLISGVTGKLFKNNSVFVSAIILFCLASTSIGLAFCSTYEEFIGVTIAYSLCNASIDVYIIHILTEIYGTKDNFEDAYALVMLAKMPSPLWGPPIAGALHDFFGAYYISFYATGTFQFIAAVSNLLVFLIQYCRG